MRRRRLWLMPAVVLLIALALLLFSDILGVEIAPFLPKIRLQRTDTRAVSSVTLDAVRDLYEFATVEYVHSAVFPQDYYLEGATDRDLSRALRRELSGAEVAALTAEERLQYETLVLASEAGMNIAAHDFLVVTVVVTAGFDLAGSTLLRSPDEGGERNPEAGFRVEVIRTPEGDRRRAIIAAPEASIIRIRVEDIVPGEYPYPDVNISADSWRRVAQFVEERVMSMDQMDALLEIAERNGRGFVREVMLRAGYDEVAFE